jgi:hypothetical protein
MKLIEYEYCWLIDDFFPTGIIAGFTKPNINGKNPREDIGKALAFLNHDFSVSYLNQIHSGIIHQVRGASLWEGDGLFTQDKNHLLIVKTADCLPVILFSEKLKTIGVIHMGWRSAQQGILNNSGFDLSLFKVFIGPAMRECCFEVGREFKDIKVFTDFLEERQGKLYFNSAKFAGSNLQRAGVGKADFVDCGICSFCSPQNLFSFRRTKQELRTLSFIMTGGR